MKCPSQILLLARARLDFWWTPPPLPGAKALQGLTAGRGLVLLPDPSVRWPR